MRMVIDLPGGARVDAHFGGFSRRTSRPRVGARLRAFGTGPSLPGTTTQAPRFWVRKKPRVPLGGGLTFAGGPMHLLVWNPAWETGIARIDDQHRTLLGQVDQLFQAIHDPDAGDQLPGMLVFLAGYVDVHFREEEAAMEAAGYPGLPAHRTAHEGMRDRLKELLARFQEDRSVLTAALLEFMVDWLVNHIDQNDRVMAAYLLRSTGA